MNVIFLKLTPENLDDIKPLKPSLKSRYVASRYDQAPEHAFQPVAFGNKNLLYLPQVHITSIKKVNPVTLQWIRPKNTNIFKSNH